MKHSLDFAIKSAAEKVSRFYILRQAYVARNLKKAGYLNTSSLRGNERKKMLALTRDLQERFEALAKERGL